MVIDAHVHMATSENDNPRARVDNILRSMDKNGIDKAVVFPFSASIENNKKLAELTKPHPDRFIPLAFINPKDPLARQDFLYALDELGFRGVKMHPWFGNFRLDDIELLRPVMEICDERRLHVVIHCTSDDDRMHPLMFRRLGECFPNAVIQMAHMGEVMAGEYAVEVARTVSNVYLDTSITSFNAVRTVMEKCPDKVFMGCDFPFYLFEMELQKQRLAAEDLGDDGPMRKIMGENFRRVFSL